MKECKIIKLFKKLENNEKVQIVLNKIGENKKIFRLISTLIFLFFSYSLLVSYAKNIEMTSTFPGIAVHVQDLVGHNEIDLNFEEINIFSKENELINGLYLGNGTGKTVYYFHGNGGPNSYFYSEIKYIHELGYNVMMYDYPGYGKSEGLPYKEKVDEASQEFFEYIKKEKGLKNSDLIVWGYSVGTAVATDFASKNDFDKLILISPLSSRYDMSRKMFGFALQKILFLKDSYVTKNLVKSFNKPVLIIHGNQDNIVSFNQGKLVFQNYAGDKNFIELDNFGHNGIIDTYGKSLEFIFKKYLNGENLGFENNYFFLGNDQKIALEKENEALKEDEKINNLDLYSDNSFQKFVTSNLSFTNKAYIPEDLVNIRGDYIYDAKGGTQKLREEAKNSLDLLSEAFYKNFGVKLSVVSAYRSYDYQVGIKAGGCPDNLCAKAGYSEHQSGLAVDLFAASSDSEWKNSSRLSSYYRWLDTNAYMYGFHNTYQRGLKIDGYEIEPWHWRYLGISLATYLKENNLTIAEYFNKKDDSSTIADFSNKKNN
ncbi:MAG: alpha/beta fold hydrolase [Candidatus Gracilibacteria bacterium]|nr:alpha/beta fold hydrolase [Candidatus Gracilibacteria bacterium]